MQILFKDKFLGLYSENLSVCASSLIKGDGPMMEFWRPAPGDLDELTY